MTPRARTFDSRVRAVDIAACELATTPSGYIAGWNTSVQAWLKTYVYRSLPRTTPRLVRQLAVFIVSSYWHGLHPGFYLCFAGMFVMVNVEALVSLAAAPFVPGWATRGLAGRALSFTCHMWTMWCFCFTGIAFNIKGWDQVLEGWASFGYYGIWLAAAPAAASVLMLAIRALSRNGRPTAPAAAPAADPPLQPPPAAAKRRASSTRRRSSPRPRSSSS